MFSIKPKITNLKAVSNAINRAVPKLLRSKLTAVASNVETQVRTTFYKLLMTHPFVNDLLFNARIRGEFGVPSREILEDILAEFSQQISVTVVGVRSPTLKISIPSKSYMLSMPKSYAFDNNGNVYPWLANIFDESFDVVRDYVYREAFGERSLTRWSRSGLGIMVPRPGKQWNAPDGYSRDFVTDIITSTEFLTFIKSIFK